MTKYTRYLLLVALCMVFVPSFSQTGQNNKKRVKNAEAIEQDITLFISENMARYDLTPEVKAAIDLQFSESDKATPYSLSKEGYSNRLKEHELRKLYLKTYSPARTALLTDEEELSYICENGGFDDGVTDDYEFLSDQIFSGPYNCATQGLTPVTASTTINDFGATVTLVDDNTAVSGGFEPILNSLSVDIPRINSGTTAIKLNNNDGNNNVTTLRRPFIVNSGEISFSYFFLAHDPGTAPDQRPHFNGRVILPDGTLVQEFCIYADASNTLQFDSVTDPGNTSPLVYTGWQCVVLSLGKLVEGDEAILEFTVTDGVTKTDFGTVYLDDICVNNGACSPKIGSIRLNATITDCVPWPVTVCGVYTLPYTTNTDPVVYGTLTSLQLNVYNAAAMSSAPVFTTTVTSSLTADEFCFNINEADLNPSILQYEYSVTATFDVLGTSYSQTFISSVVGPDLDITGCISGGEDCPYCPTITADVPSGTDYVQAEWCINAENTVSGTGTEAIYHAGYEVVLNDGFDALSGTKDRFYIKGCSDPEVYTARYAAPAGKAEFDINLVEAEPAHNNVAVYPNPANAEVTITAANGLLVKNIIMYGTDGRQVLQLNGIDAISFKADISKLSNGVYILSVITNDGMISVKKIVKN